MNCLFCKIAQKEISAEVVYEDENTIAVLDINPCSPGHAMILSKKHFVTILELELSEIGPIFFAVKKVVAMLKKTLSPDGFTIGINHGKTAGQAIEHLHIHIIPRYNNDGGGSIHNVVKNPPNDSLQEIKGKILGKIIKHG